VLGDSVIAHDILVDDALLVTLAAIFSNGRLWPLFVESPSKNRAELNTSLMSER